MVVLPPSLASNWIFLFKAELVRAFIESNAKNQFCWTNSKNKQLKKCKITGTLTVVEKKSCTFVAAENLSFFELRYPVICALHCERFPPRGISLEDFWLMIFFAITSRLSSFQHLCFHCWHKWLMGIQGRQDVTHCVGVGVKIWQTRKSKTILDLSFLVPFSGKLGERF